MIKFFLISLAFLFTSSRFVAANGLQSRLISSNTVHSTAEQNQVTNFQIALRSPYSAPNGKFEFLFFAASNEASASDGQADYGAFDFAHATVRCPTANDTFNFSTGTITPASIANVTYNNDYYHLVTCDYTGNGNQGDFGFTNNNLFEINNVINPKNDPAHNPREFLFAPIWIRQISQSGDIIYHQAENVTLSQNVQISATVVDQITIILSGVEAEATACGQTTTRSTTGSLADFGVINDTDFVDLAQKLTVLTNQDNYVVTVIQSDQLGLENAAGEAATCLDDGTLYDNCINDAAVTDMDAYTAQPWIDPTQGHGFAFTMENITGNDALFSYQNGYRHFADQENLESPVLIISQANRQTDSNYLCYRLIANDRNLTGYYHNNLTYTVTTTF